MKEHRGKPWRSDDEEATGSAVICLTVCVAALVAPFALIAVAASAAIDWTLGD